eukprot:4187978-Pyramimonas_sp.AAC.1
MDEGGGAIMACLGRWGCVFKIYSGAESCVKCTLPRGVDRPERGGIYWRTPSYHVALEPRLKEDTPHV